MEEVGERLLSDSRNGERDDGDFDDSGMSINLFLLHLTLLTIGAHRSSTTTIACSILPTLWLSSMSLPLSQTSLMTSTGRSLSLTTGELRLAFAQAPVTHLHLPLSSKSLEIVQGRHPTVETALLSQGREFTPNSVSFHHPDDTASDPSLIHVVTGPVSLLLFFSHRLDLNQFHKSEHGGKEYLLATDRSHHDSRTSRIVCPRSLGSYRCIRQGIQSCRSSRRT